MSAAYFGLSPKPRYLFLREQHRDAWDSLIYGEKGFVLLSGNIGMRGNTVGRSLLASLDNSAETGRERI